MGRRCHASPRRGAAAFSERERLGRLCVSASPVCFVRRMDTDCNPMELSSVSGFEADAERNGFEGTDMKDMRLEAEAVVNDVLFAVDSMFVSTTLRCAHDVAYINVETRERSRYCLELTEAGLRVSLSAVLSPLHPRGSGSGKSVKGRSVASKVFLKETFF